MIVFLILFIQYACVIGLIFKDNTLPVEYQNKQRFFLHLIPLYFIYRFIRYNINNLKLYNENRKTKKYTLKLE